MTSQEQNIPLKPFSLRPNGRALVVGQTDTTLSELDTYQICLNKAMMSWRKCLPEDYEQDETYRACGFLGIGAWNFITLTLVAELGLANHLAYLGRMRGQSFFYAHDMGLMIHADRLTEFPIALIEACNRIKLTCIIKDPDKTYDQDIMRLCGEPVSSKVGPNLDDKWFRWHHPIQLNHIFSGDLLPELDEPDEQLGNGEELLGIFQLKVNPRMKCQLDKSDDSFHKGMPDPSCQLGEGALLMLWLGVIDTLDRFLQQLEGISLTRLMYSSGYFDFLVLVRGTNIDAMDQLMQEIKALRYDDNLLSRFDLAHDFQLPESLKGEPLFVLSQTTYGVPNGKVKALRTALDQRLPDISEGIGPDKDQIYSLYWEIRQTLPNYHGLIIPLTGISTQPMHMGPLHGIVTKLRAAMDKAHGFHTPAGDVNINSGRYDLELFQGRKIHFGDYLFWTLLLSGLVHHSGHKPPINLLTVQTYLGMKCHLPADLVPSLSWNEPDELFTLTKLFKHLVKQHNLKPLITEQVEAQATDILLAGERSARFWLNITDESAENDYELFREYLQSQFGHWVSLQTQEMFRATVFAIYGFLKTYQQRHLYFDVAKFLISKFVVMLTMAPGSDADHISFLDPINLRRRELSSKRGSIAGPSADLKSAESFFLNTVDVLQHVIGQRQAGAYPHQDRSFSRLSDVHVQHARKLLYTSWMVNRVIFEMSCELSRFFGLFDAPGPLEVKRQLNSWPDAFLVQFGNSPEVCIAQDHGTLFLDARLLGHNEGLVLVAHEIGHYFEKFIPEEDRSYPPDNSKMDRSITIKKPDIISDIWKEVQADLFMWRLCFSQVTLLHRLEIDDVYDEEAKRTLKPGEHCVTQQEDFVLCLIAHSMTLAKIIRPMGMKIFKLRIAILLSVLVYTAQGGCDNDDDFEAFYTQNVAPFLGGRLETFLFQCRKEAKNPLWANSIWEKGFELDETEKTQWKQAMKKYLKDLKKDNPQALYRLYLSDPSGAHDTWVTQFGNWPRESHALPIWLLRLLSLDPPGKKEHQEWSSYSFSREMLGVIAEWEVDHHIKLQDFQLDSSDSTKANIQAKNCLTPWLKRFSPRQASLILRYQNDLKFERSSFLRKHGLNKPELFPPLLQGILDREPVADKDCYAVALQLTGFLSLGLTQGFRVSKTEYAHGSFFYQCPRIQKKFNRVRMLVTHLLARGSWLEMGLFMKKPLPQFRGNHTDTDQSPDE